jgi:hypothetical protein
LEIWGRNKKNKNKIKRIPKRLTESGAKQTGSRGGAVSKLKNGERQARNECSDEIFHSSQPKGFSSASMMSCRRGAGASAKCWAVQMRYRGSSGSSADVLESVNFEGRWGINWLRGLLKFSGQRFPSPRSLPTGACGVISHFECRKGKSTARTGFPMRIPCTFFKEMEFLQCRLTELTGDAAGHAPMQYRIDCR